MASATHSASLRHVEDQYRKYHNPTLVRLVKFGGYGAVETRAEGMYVYDEAGTPWLDFAGGYGVFAFGHCHPRILAAVEQQLHRMPLSAKVFFNAPLADFCERLAGVTPGDLQFSFLVSSGTEAVEGALKLARLATGRTRIIAASNAYHGKTIGALSVSGRDLFKTPFEPLMPETELVAYGDSEALSAAVDEHTAAVILEPLQGEGGIVVPPDGYLHHAREVCTRHGALLIADEVQTGFGRTGKTFAVEHEGVVPDLLALGKAIGGGVMPLGAFVGRPAVWEAFHANPLIHTSTFGGNPLACAAGIAALQVLEEEDLTRRSAEMGALLKAGLQEVQQAHPGVVAEVRGRGLMLGVELTQERYGGAIIMEMAKRHVIAVYTLNQPRVLRFEPPLVVERSHIETAVTAFGEAVRKAESMFGEKQA
ncbi:MAG: aspartate aminotransferase family protein [Candidatus Xenobia bacterium]